MSKRIRKSAWAKSFERSFSTLSRLAAASGTRALARALKPARKLVVPRALKPALTPGLKPAMARRQPPGASRTGAWITGVALGATGARRFRLFRPPGVGFAERLPLMVMLHGCGQDAASFATSTRMNQIATRERFLVLYPEQDRLANAKGCWNWFDTGSGRAYGEAALIMKAIDQVCLLYPVDRAQVAIAGLSAGASMAALLVTRHPGRFKAVVMHSGVPPGTAHSGLTALGAMKGLRLTLPLAATPGAMAAVWPPLLVIHGDADGVVAPHNGWVAAQVWAQAAGALAGPARRVQRGQRHAMSITDFKRQGSTVATLVAVDRLAHAWSGGAASTPFGDGQGPDASRMAWAFAARQFRSAA
jgi:poly(hydroxyalkanoate) depolymerase family esterase